MTFIFVVHSHYVAATSNPLAWMTHAYEDLPVVTFPASNA